MSEPEKVTGTTITDQQIEQLRQWSRAPHGYIGDTWYHADLAMSKIPAVRRDARERLAAGWNARASRGDS